ncbi:uncharacterized protein EAF02_007682 [Botrytis sinoallii]|uniref:Uncharacterized protein n=1 Tax=Botrytis deweyae TaxID=2478750 RepID=A0ABQ7IKL1_9HELO|nr:uncharacterized protein EAF02_007682 [Botrytis sinoallii]XP_038809737.1 uncharacterized protein EAE98_006324 [Botrytis deweyae]KAF7880045.1 hypothetical protein EAF02_007682 [Botrytis sinoallii]KAF7926940.1 hypothetical protein EAE98_006324 [Botrytis deweyae]
MYIAMTLWKPSYAPSMGPRPVSSGELTPENYATRAFRDINSLHDLASGDDGDLILQLKIAFRSYPPSIGLGSFH